MFKLKVTVATFSYLFPINNYSGVVIKATGLEHPSGAPTLPKEAGNINMSSVPLFQTKRAQL